MEFWKRSVVSAFAIGLGIMLAGCEPPGQSAADDQKEPHFILGQNRVSAMDYKGAVEAFESSLEANPHSAAAHFQLAMLYDEKEDNPAAAIYHYQQYLRLDPKAINAEVVIQHIYSCKLQLAKDVLGLPSSPAAQQQLQQVINNNRQLQDELDRWRAYYASQSAAVKTNLPSVLVNSAPPSNSVLIPSTPAVSNPRPPAVKIHTHTVAARETLAVIARKYGVNLNALLAANSGLNPKKLHVGQIINLPLP
jgi:LysM repeat protein